MTAGNTTENLPLGSTDQELRVSSRSGSRRHFSRRRESDTVSLEVPLLFPHQTRVSQMVRPDQAILLSQLEFATGMPSRSIARARSSEDVPPDAFGVRSAAVAQTSPMTLELIQLVCGRENTWCSSSTPCACAASRIGRRFSG